MSNYVFKGVNSFLVEMARILLKDGVKRQTRGYICYEMPEPVLIKIENPTARIVTVPARNWNCTLPYVESLWLASGRNDISMVAHYVERMIDFSDDNKTMRGGYGPRLRHFTGVADDYNNGFLHTSTNPGSLNTTEIDQFEFVEKTFIKDPLTRQAIITIGDPAKDCFGGEHVLKQTKDFPCTRDLQFIQNNGKLDLIVHMRSNDFLWGAGGVNIFNFTFIQEYFARILRLPIGDYYHIANNLHYYETRKEMVIKIAETTDYKDIPYEYSKKFSSLTEFDERLMSFQKYEFLLRQGRTNDLIDFDDDFFSDWAKVLYQFKNKSSKGIDYVNPVLGEVMRKPKTKSAARDQKSQLIGSFTMGGDGVSKNYWRQYI